MTDLNCPKCGEPTGPLDHNCPKRLEGAPHEALDNQTPGDAPLTDELNAADQFELDIPRLGEYLLERGVISASDLQQALEYQNNSDRDGSKPLLGQALVELELIDRTVLDEAITDQIFSLQSALIDNNRYLDEKVRQRTQEIERRLSQTRLVGDITQYAIAATDLGDLLNRTVTLVVERFPYAYAAIYLVEEKGQLAELAASFGSSSLDLSTTGDKFGIGFQSIVSWVATNNQYIVTSKTGQQASTNSSQSGYIEIGLPMSIGDSVLGVLLVQSGDQDKDNQDDVEVLEKIANHIAAVVQNFRLLEKTRYHFDVTNWLYQTSKELSLSNSIDEVNAAIGRAIEGSFHTSAYLVVDRGNLKCTAMCDLHLQGGLDDPDFLKLFSVKLADLEAILPLDVPRVVSTMDNEFSNYDLFTSIDQHMQWNSMGLIPVRSKGSLPGLILVGETRSQEVSQIDLQPFTYLAELASQTYARVASSEHARKQEIILDIMNTLSQAISMETDLNSLYLLIHTQVKRVMGEVDFLIALYDKENNTIEIPYAIEDDEFIELPSFPLGEGLTSVLIQTRSPLMILEDAEQRAIELGAKVFGTYAKSWLGVPLIVGKDVIGAIIVQDLQTEYRFNQQDQLLLSTIATPVAVTIKNARLLHDNRQRIDHSQIVKEITARLWSSTDINTILRTAMLELGRSMHASEGIILLEAPVLEQSHSDFEHDAILTPDNEVPL
jgi:transcriptional regulator with GAF, ATPase, and Fis domain